MGRTYSESTHKEDNQAFGFCCHIKKREGTKKRMQNIELFWRVIEEKEQMDDTLQQERNITPLNKYIVKYELVK